MYPYVMPQPQQQNWGPKEWGKFFKSMNGPDKKDKDKENFRLIPIRKPKTYTVAQAMLITTALFPIIGPAYYFAVMGSWILLKAGMMAILQ